MISRLDFLFKDLSQHFGIYLVVFALKLFHRHEVRGDLTSKVIQPQPKYKNRNFQNLIRKRLLRDIN